MQLDFMHRCMLDQPSILWRLNVMSVKKYAPPHILALRYCMWMLVVGFRFAPPNNNLNTCVFQKQKIPPSIKS